MQPPTDCADVVTLAPPGTWRPQTWICKMTASVQREIARIRRICFHSSLSANPVKRGKGGRAWQMGASPDRRPTGAGQSAREDPGCIWPYLRARHGKTVAKGIAPR